MNLSHLSKDATILAMRGAEPGKSASDMTDQEIEKAAKVGTAKVDDAYRPKAHLRRFLEAARVPPLGGSNTRSIGGTLAQIS